MKLTNGEKRIILKAINIIETLMDIGKKLLLIIGVIMFVLIICSIDSLIDLMPSWLSTLLCIGGIILFISKSIWLIEDIDKNFLSKLYVEEENKNEKDN